MRTEPSLRFQKQLTIKAAQNEYDKFLLPHPAGRALVNIY
jgi:hypothetical protein